MIFLIIWVLIGLFFRFRCIVVGVGILVGSGVVIGVIVVVDVVVVFFVLCSIWFNVCNCVGLSLILVSWDVLRCCLMGMKWFWVKVVKLLVSSSVENRYWCM